jgi:hypothetical protein
MLNKENPPQADRLLSGKTKLFVFLFLAGSIIPNLLLAQFSQQGPKFVGTGGIGAIVNQGRSVAISSDGNTAIVGGYEDNSLAGAVWAFTRSGGVWTQQGAKLVGTGAVGNAGQGWSIAISSDGNTVIVGGHYDNGNAGAVWVFIRSGGVWSQQGQKLIGTGGIGAIVNQGYSVAISSDGNTIIEGGESDNSLTGAAWVFTRTGSVWTQQGQKLVGTGAVGSANQGYSVTISSDGNTAIVGGPGDSSLAGAVWVFTRSGGVWTQLGLKLVGAGGVGGIVQGSSVAISSDGNTAIVGGPGDNSSAGAMWIFTRSGSVWAQQGPKLIGIAAVGNSLQGISVTISSDGNTAIEGGSYDNNHAGAVWVFTRSGSIWTQLGSKLVGTGAVGNALQGTSVSISSEGTLIEGGHYDNNQQGAVWAFINPTIGISQISSIVPAKFSLEQNYPNPFNPNSKIRFQIAKLGNAMLVVYDMQGKEVSTLVNQQLKPGTYEVDFDGSRFSSGVYFYKLSAEDFLQTKKMTLIK